MPDASALVALIETHGLSLLAPLALIEGPIVTVIAGYLTSLGLMNLWAVAACVILADLLGDAIFYAIGRHGRRIIPAHWMARIGLKRNRLARLVRGFRRNDVRFLVIGKLTHSAGFAVLTAAGIAKMRFGRFMLINLLTTTPKSFALIGLGWVFGAAYARIDIWIVRISILVFALIVLGVMVRMFWLRKEDTHV